MTINNQQLEQFKSGIFNLGTNFGELAQLMIEKLEGFTPAGEKYYDLLDSTEKKIEVKFSRAKKKLKSLSSTNIIDYCMFSSTERRLLTESQSNEFTFDCNIQQIKPSEFDTLYYGIFFIDKIIIFTADSSIVPSIPGYSIQHKGGTEYQFHINKSNYTTYHKRHRFYKELSYAELFELFSQE